jgi:hypothetical protein
VAFIVVVGKVAGFQAANVIQSVCIISENELLEVSSIAVASAAPDAECD